MAWIESHQELARHPKLARLCRLLKCNKAQAIGHLHLLWWWTLDFAPDGCLSAFTPTEIAGASEWSGSVELFGKALRESGFIKGDRVNDWEDYSGRLVTARRMNRERQKRFRESTRDITVTSPLRNALPNPTEPNSTEPNRTQPNPDAPPRGVVAKDPANIPKELHSPAFTASWQRWMTFRRGLGKKPKDWAAMFSEQLEWLRAFGAAEATEILNQSIRNGWQGLFERKQHGSNTRNAFIADSGGGGGQSKYDRMRAREAEAKSKAGREAAGTGVGAQVAGP